MTTAADQIIADVQAHHTGHMTECPDCSWSHCDHYDCDCGQQASEAPVWYADSAHAWLRVPLAYVLASGYKPTAYSYRSSEYAYLEEDADAPAYLKHVGVWDGERDTFPQFADDYRDGMRSDVRGLPQWGGDSRMYRQVLAS